jgi:hypothetical protein
MGVGSVLVCIRAGGWRITRAVSATTRRPAAAQWAALNEMSWGDGERERKKGVDMVKRTCIMILGTQSIAQSIGFD